MNTENIRLIEEALRTQENRELMASAIGEMILAYKSLDAANDADVVDAAQAFAGSMKAIQTAAIRVATRGGALTLSDEAA